MREIFCIFVILAGVMSAVHAEDASGVEELVAPVAFFPDSLLAHVLPASTYPAEVIGASRRLNALSADQNEFSVEAQRWAPVVKSLAQAPLLLEWMASQPSWMVALGNAFLKDSAGVLEAVQALRLQALGTGTLLTVAEFLVEVEDGFLLVYSAENGSVPVPPLDRRNWSEDGDWELAGEISQNLIFLKIDWDEGKIRLRPAENLHPWIAEHPMWLKEEPQVWQHKAPHRLGVLYPVPSESLDDLDLSFEVNWEPGYGKWTGNFPASMRMPLMRSRIAGPGPEIFESSDFEVDDLLPEALPPRPLPSINRVVQWPESAPQYSRLAGYPPGGGVEQRQVSKSAFEPRGNREFCSVASMLGRRLLSVD